MKISYKNTAAFSFYIFYLLLTSFHLDANSDLFTQHNFSRNLSSGNTYYETNNDDNLLLKVYFPSKRSFISTILFFYFDETTNLKNKQNHYFDYISRIFQLNFNFPISAYKFSLSIYTADF
jgi:hypothetical protein